MTELDDGRYDVFILEAEIVDSTSMRLELAMVSGDDKGSIFAVRGPHLAADEAALLGLPATLVVQGGLPSVELDGN